MRCMSKAFAWTTKARRWQAAPRSGIHESQSRLWENIVGRSRPFWQYWYPQVQATFPDQLGAGRSRHLLPRHQQSAALADPH